MNETLGPSSHRFIKGLVWLRERVRQSPKSLRESQAANCQIVRLPFQCRAHAASLLAAPSWAGVVGLSAVRGPWMGFCNMACMACLTCIAHMPCLIGMPCMQGMSGMPGGPGMACLAALTALTARTTGTARTVLNSSEQFL